MGRQPTGGRRTLIGRVSDSSARDRDRRTDQHDPEEDEHRTFTVVTSTGKVTGGVTVANGHSTFVADGNADTLKGELKWGDYRATEITALGIAPDTKSAWFAGVSVDGRTFLAYVEDNGEPSTHDVFRLRIAGTLITPDSRVVGGNMQIH